MRKNSFSFEQKLSFNDFLRTSLLLLFRLVLFPNFVFLNNVVVIFVVVVAAAAVVVW